MEPLKFKPLLKQTLWGGNKIVAFKNIDSDLQNVGESWEISGVKGNETIVANGPYAGTPLNSLVAELKDELVGKANYERFGNEFPLLIKFIDASQDLSIQVHPSDEIAHRQGKERGKTEMWYALNSDADAKLYNGLKKVITPEQYKAMVENDTITDALAQYAVSEGDVFFIPAGRIHAIGKGCFVAEIQQTSDVTYRIYDFKRKDKDGNYRQLHTEEAAECIDYNVSEDYRTHYTATPNHGEEVVSCPYFTTTVYNVTDSLDIDFSAIASFVILIATKGEATLTDSLGNTTSIKAGETVLFPATNKSIKVEGNINLLGTWV